MKAYIYAGGAVDAGLIDDCPEPGDLTVAADAGWRNAQALGVTPAVLVGDFDSLGEPVVPQGTEIVRVPAEKDDTDTQLAVRVALDRGAAEIILIAGLGGRVDHTLNKTGRRGMVTDGKNRVRLLQNGSLLLARDVRYRYLSLLTLSEKAKGVSLEGCKYPLHGATLTRTRQYAVSNEITGNAALIAVRRGTLFVVESAD